MRSWQQSAAAAARRAIDGQIWAYQNELEQRGLVHLHKILVPGADLLLSLCWLVILRLHLGCHMEFAILHDLCKDLC